MTYPALTKQLETLSKQTGRALVKEAAEYCGVSRFTIRRVLRKEGYRNDKAAQKILEFLTVVHNDHMQLQTTLQYLEQNEV